MWWNVSPRSQHDKTEGYIFIDEIFDMISEFGLNDMEKINHNIYILYNSKIPLKRKPQ